MADFGRSNFGQSTAHHPTKEKIGQMRSGQIRSNKIGQIRPNKVGQMRPVKFGQMWYWPNSVWPNAVATQFSFFSSSLVWCLKRRGAQMCAFGVLWLSCEAPTRKKRAKFGRSGGGRRVQRRGPKILKTQTKLEDTHQKL